MPQDKVLDKVATAVANYDVGLDIRPDDSKQVLWVNLQYPRTTEDRHPVTTVQIALTDVRAANCIRVEYDFERDGWVVKQMPEECLGEDDPFKEVAFVPGNPE